MSGTIQGLKHDAVAASGGLWRSHGSSINLANKTHTTSSSFWHGKWGCHKQFSLNTMPFIRACSTSTFRSFVVPKITSPPFPLPTKCTASFLCHRGPVNGLATLPDGKLASGSGDPDRAVKVKDLNTLKTTTLYRVPSATAVYGFSVLMRNWLLAAGSDDGHIDFWYPNGVDAGRFGGVENGSKSRITTLSAFLDTRFNKYYVISGASDGDLKVWDTASYYPHPHYSIGSHHLSVNALTMFRYKNSLGFDREALASGSSDHTIKVWDPYQFLSKLLLSFSHDAPVRALTVLEKNRDIIVSGSEDRTIRVWNPSQPGNALINKFDKKRDGSSFTAVYSLASFPEGAIASGHLNGEINLWNPLDLDSPHL